jgi:hypothetical protein
MDTQTNLVYTVVLTSLLSTYLIVEVPYMTKIVGTRICMLYRILVYVQANALLYNYLT